MINKKILLRSWKQNLSRRCYSNKMYDVAIVGGGIVGTSVAQRLLETQPHLKCVLLEKEDDIAMHQSGRNSGVIHAGMYYAPGSLRAKLCVRGMDLLYKHCDKYKLPYKKVGKLIVATSPNEIMSLQNLYDRGRTNNVPGLTLVANEEIQQIEPHCKGLVALYSPNTGIIDYSEVAKSFAVNYAQRGGALVYNFKVQDLLYDIEDAEYPVTIINENEEHIRSKFVITCAGLYADRMAGLSYCKKEPALVAFRGDYLMLKPEKQHLVKGNIYPVPNATLPFLGEHFTPRMDGSVWLGPNAVLAFSRQGYRLTDVNLKDTVQALSQRGVWKLLGKHWRFAGNEMYNSIFPKSMVERLQRFIPQLTPDDVIRGPSGVRAQAITSEGDLVEDFVFDTGPGGLGRRCLHVRNAPSPAATSSLAIAEMVVERFNDIQNRLSS